MKGNEKKKKEKEQRKASETKNRDRMENYRVPVNESEKSAIFPESFRRFSASISPIFDSARIGSSKNRGIGSSIGSHERIHARRKIGGACTHPSPAQPRCPFQICLELAPFDEVTSREKAGMYPKNVLLPR